MVSISLPSVVRAAVNTDLSDSEIKAWGEKIRKIESEIESLTKVSKSIESRAREFKDAGTGQLELKIRARVLASKNARLEAVARNFPYTELKNLVEAGKPSAYILYSKLESLTFLIDSEFNFSENKYKLLLDWMNKTLEVRKADGLPIHLFECFKHLSSEEEWEAKISRAAKITGTNPEVLNEAVADTFNTVGHRLEGFYMEIQNGVLRKYALGSRAPWDSYRHGAIKHGEYGKLPMNRGKEAAEAFEKADQGVQEVLKLIEEGKRVDVLREVVKEAIRTRGRL